MAILKPAPSSLIFLDGLEAFGGMGVMGLSGGEEQVAVGAVLVAADAAAKLVQVGQAEAVGLVDEDRVGVGDVEAALDDRGGDEEVGLVADEVEHHLFEFVLVPSGRGR